MRLYRLCAAAIALVATATPAVAGVYKCVGSDGSTSYSDTPCAGNAESIKLQPATPTAPSGLEIQTATYASPRNGRSLDATTQVKALCANGSASCTLNCGNPLAGDPDFGQRKYCSITYRCDGGPALQQRIPEGGRLTLACSREMVRAAKQNTLPLPNSEVTPPAPPSADASTSMSASTGLSGARGATAGTLAPKLPMNQRANPSDINALATILQRMGGDEPDTKFDTLAALQMRLVIGPNDPTWNHTNPRYAALFKMVKEDLQHDLEPAFRAQMAQALQELTDVLGSRVPAIDVKQLLGFYRSNEGQRYLAFQDRIGSIQTQGLTELTMGMVGAGMSRVPSAAPSQAVLDERRRLLADSWVSLIVPDVLSGSTKTGSPGAGDFFKAMLDVVARNHGPEIDAVGGDYARDLPQFESFHQSPAAQLLVSALHEGIKEDVAQRPVTPNLFKTALDRSVATHGPQWKAAYEAGRPNTPNTESRNPQGDLSPLVALGQVAAALEAQKPSVLKPGDADYPERVADPARIVPLVVIGRDGADMRFNAEWVSDEKLCGHQVGLGGYFRYTLSFPIAMTRSGDTYRGSVVVDSFKSGRCGWRLSSVNYAMVDGVQNALAVPVPADRGDPPVERREFWCYRVTYENKPVHECQELALLRWSNATRAVSRDFLSQFSHEQQNDAHVPGITEHTKEIHITLHDLNAIPGALIPVGDRDAQLARAKAEEDARQQTPEYKASECEDAERLVWIKSHNRPLPDEATQRAAYEAIHAKCRAAFGLPASPLFDNCDANPRNRCTISVTR